MDITKRQAADKIRPILAAMERSIDSARRRRLNIDDDQPKQAMSANESTPQAQSLSPKPFDKRDELIAVPATKTNAVKSEPVPGTDDEALPGKARLKARPKRPVGFSSGPDQPFYGSKAG